MRLYGKENFANNTEKDYECECVCVMSSAVE